MTKIVLNKCYGGFALSYKAILLIEKYSDGKFKFSESEHEIGKREGVLHYFDFQNKLEFRTSPALIQAVEELGKDSCGDHSFLKIEEFDETKPHYFKEYDGFESVDTTIGFLE